MIEAKKEGQKVVETPEPHVAPVIDIMEALKAAWRRRRSRCRWPPRRLAKRRKKRRRAGGEEARAKAI
jgi:non-homologous end joining protein Ku